MTPGSPVSVSRPPGWLERTFLYTLGLLGLVMLLHSSSRDTLVILAQPRYIAHTPDKSD